MCIRDRPEPEPEPEKAAKAPRVRGPKPIATPTRRSGRHAPEPEAPATEPCILKEMDQKDSFKYFNTGWLLPPGARRNNRPKPPPVVRKDRKRTSRT